MSRHLFQGKTVHISAPTQKLRKYLELVGEQDESELSEEARQRIFVTAVADFSRGRLDLDELSEIGSWLLSCQTGSVTEQARSTLNDVLETCREISYVIRFDYEDGESTPFDLYMKEIWDYYRKHKTACLR